VAGPRCCGAARATFAVTYVAIQLGRPLYLLFAERGHQRRIPAQKFGWTAISAVPWIAGAALFPQSPARGALWTLALSLDYTGFVLGWPVPGLGRTRVEDWNAAPQSSLLVTISAALRPDPGRPLAQVRGSDLGQTSASPCPT
jgi:low temperature requirement protein LtrA